MYNTSTSYSCFITLMMKISFNLIIIMLSLPHIHTSIIQTHTEIGYDKENFWDIETVVEGNVNSESWLNSCVGWGCYIPILYQKAADAGIWRETFYIITKHKILFPSTSSLGENQMKNANENTVDNGMVIFVGIKFRTW